MADPTIKIKRSSVSGKIPTTTQLSLGEFAINTTDGKVYIEQESGGVGIGTTIIVVNPWSVGSGTNTYNTYFTSGNVGVGTTNPTSKLYVEGDGYFTGILTANRIISSVYGEFTGGSISGTNIVGTSLSVSGISTLGIVQISSGVITATSGVVTYYGDGGNLTNVKISISTNTTNSNQYITYSTGFGNTTGLGASNTFVVNPSTGNLGIGTTNPQVKLQVGGVIGFNGTNVRIGGTDTGRSLTSGTLNVFIGAGAGAGTTSGVQNNFIGANAGFCNNSGLLNSFFGAFSGESNTTGIVNSFFGAVSGAYNTTGSSNFFGGGYSGLTNTSGNYNVFLGSFTGISNISSRKVIIGTGVDSTNLFDSPSTTKNTQLAIGVRTDANPSNYWIVGDENFNIGIGTTNPTQKLHVQGNLRTTGAIYDSTNSPGTSGQVLQSTVTGTQWATATAAAGGSGKFDTSIDSVLYIQPTGTLDIVGVGTTTSQITTLPSGSNKYIIHSVHVTNVSSGDAEITAGFLINSRQVPASISVGGGPGIHTITVGSASSITVGMAVTGTGNSGDTTGIGTTGGFQYNTYVTSVDGSVLTLSKPLSGLVSSTAYFTALTETVYRLPVPVGSAVELLKQPFILNALDSIVLQSTGAGSGIGSTSTAAISQTSGSNFLTVTAGAAITSFIAAGQLINGTGSNTGIQTGTYVGVGYTPGSLTVPMTKPATSTLSSQILSFTETVVPQDGALQATIVYQSTTDTAYLNGTGTVAGISSITSTSLGISSVPVSYYGTGNLYPSTIQSIRVANISDIGDYPVWVGIGNTDTIFSWLAYNMVIPKNSNVELCEAPKRLGIGQSIFAYSDTPNVIEIQIAGKQKTS